MRLEAGHIEPLVLGGALLGGGGGGDPDEGRRFARTALEAGAPRLVEVEELAPDAVVVTVALVGAPSAPDQYVAVEDLVRSVRLLSERFSLRIDALNGNENGGFASVNGWVQSAALGLPLVDAPCNGRAHPTAVMGAMGLHRVSGYSSLQAAVGGAPGTRHLEMTVTAPVEVASALVRQASIQAGGLVAVARNPVEARYLASHGAPGAVSMALRAGSALLEAIPKGAAAAWEAAAQAVGGSVIEVGSVVGLSLETTGGFDRGVVEIDGEARCELAFWNEYMTLERDGRRLATFPDLIATLDDRGLPLATSAIRKGQRVAVVAAPKEALRLGAGMRDPELFRVAEQVTGKSLIPYAFK